MPESGEHDTDAANDAADADKLPEGAVPLTIDALLLIVLRLLARDQYADRRHDRELRQIREGLTEAPPPIDPHNIGGHVFEDGRIDGTVGGVPFRIDAKGNVKMGDEPDDEPAPTD